MIDRAEASRALAKVIAYANVGKDFEADVWMIKLIKLLDKEYMIEDWGYGMAQQAMATADRIR